MLTTAEVAKLLNISPRRVLALAEARGIRPAMTVGTAKLWRKSQVERLRPGKVGRPAKAL